MASSIQQEADQRWIPRRLWLERQSRQPHLSSRPSASGFWRAAAHQLSTFPTSIPVPPIAAPPPPRWVLL